MLPKVYMINPMLGCDPEFFFVQDGEVIGAEKVLPKSGLTVGKYATSKFIIDGVQAELNPRPNTCRGLLGNEIAVCFQRLKEQLKKSENKGISVDFSRTLEISKEKLMELDEASRKFGCAPSKSIYKTLKSMLRIEDVDPTKYRKRAAGGHIHLGHGDSSLLKKALVSDCEKTVEMLDLLVGNTSVLLDRDEGNIERRKTYGRAGEYRTPKHGLEYRTLSNYWLTSAELFSFAFGMARLAVQLMADQKNHALFYNEFMEKVKINKVRDAINYNDFDTAMENFTNIAHLITDVSINNGHHALSSDTIYEFMYFVSKIQKEGLKYWFKDDPMTHWCKVTDTHNHGFHDFLKNKVAKDMPKREVKMTYYKNAIITTVSFGTAPKHQVAEVPVAARA